MHKKEKEQQETETKVDQPAARTVQRAARRLSANRAWWQVVLIGALAIALGLGMLYALHMLARPLALFLMGISIAAALSPLVRALSSRIPRVFAVVLVYLVLIFILVGLGLVVVPPLAGQIASAVKQFPDLAKRIQTLATQWDSLIGGSLISTLGGQLGNFGSTLLAVPLQLTSTVIDAGVVIFVSIYALIEGPVIQRFFLSLFPSEGIDELDALLDEIASALGGYIRATAINGMIIGTCMYIGLSLIGVNYPLVLGILAGLMETIPILGAVIAAIPILITAYLQSPGMALTTLIFVIVLQQSETHILIPNIMRSQTEISPLLATLTLFAGGAIGGLLGALVAIPFVSALTVFINRIIVPVVRVQTGATPISIEQAEEEEI